MLNRRLFGILLIALAGPAAMAQAPGIAASRAAAPARLVASYPTLIQVEGSPGQPFEFPSEADAARGGSGYRAAIAYARHGSPPGTRRSYGPKVDFQAIHSEPFAAKGIIFKGQYERSAHVLRPGGFA